MTPAGRRLTALAVGVGLLVGAGVADATDRGDSADDDPTAAAMLQQAATASQSLAYAGTKYVTAWRPTGTESSLVDVRHDAHHGLSLQVSPTAAPAQDDGLVLAGSTLDGTLLSVLGQAYALRLAATGRCAGRVADVVEAVRPQSGTVAGRFWVDRSTRLLLRREVYDDAGRRVRSSAFLDLDVSPASPVIAPVADRPSGAPDAGTVVPAEQLGRLRAAGWPLPATLPGGFVLFDARSRSHGGGSSAQVLHLAYTDGLSTTSLFVQQGGLGRTPPSGFVLRIVGGRSVWANDGAPERLVWSGGGRVLTLVSDAPEPAVGAAVDALPHQPLPPRGFVARLHRGLSRLGQWLNPFD